MVNVVFNGVVSAQSNSGETVTLTITKPSGTADVITATTNADKTFTATKAYTAGTYSVTASIGADAEYKATSSTSITFTVNLLDRTVTVTVTV